MPVVAAAADAVNDGNEPGDEIRLSITNKKLSIVDLLGLDSRFIVPTGFTLESATFKKMGPTNLWAIPSRRPTATYWGIFLALWGA